MIKVMASNDNNTDSSRKGAVAELSGSRADTVRVSDQRTAVSPPTLGDRFSRHLLHAFYLFRSWMMVSIYWTRFVFVSSRPTIQ